MKISEEIVKGRFALLHSDKVSQKLGRKQFANIFVNYKWGKKV